MSGIRRWATFLALILAAAAAGAQTTGIVNSKHNFSTWATGQQICVACHTPHNGGAGAGPLWNHASTTTTFTLYSSPTLTAGTGTLPGVTQPAGASRACLSCHDGTVAIDSYGGNTGTTFITTIGTPPGRANLGTSLSDDHPVSFTYNGALATADGELVDPAALNSFGPGATIQAKMLFNDQLECASCHDVHNSFGHPSLLVKSNVGSALCLTCHIK